MNIFGDAYKILVERGGTHAADGENVTMGIPVDGYHAAKIRKHA